jgi:glycosyltransferase involved in cell wall biosynthesis
VKSAEKKITVLMALKDASSTMDISIRSVIEQKYSNFDLIFSVADSNDDTLNKLEKIAESFPVKLILNQNEGIYHALNSGLNAADPESLVCILGSGDFFLHDRVFDLVNRDLRNSGDWCISPWVLTESNYEFVEVSGLQDFSGSEVLTTRVPLCHQSVFAEAQMMNAVGKFKPRYRVAADRDLIFKLWKNRAPIVLNTVNVVYPQGGFSSHNEIQGHKELKNLYRSNLIKYPFLKPSIRRNLQTKGKYLENMIPNNIFPWCPSSVLAGVTN